MDDFIRSPRTRLSPKNRPRFKSADEIKLKPVKVEVKTDPEPEETAKTTVPPPPDKPRLKRRWLFFDRKPLSKKQWLILVVSLLVLLVGGAWGSWSLYKKVSRIPTQPIAKAKPKAKPTTEPSRLTGVQVDPELNKRPVTGIMIENSLDARPQSGLKDAGVVFEAVAEGGITRFLALFQEAQPDYIGPVRSARPYYLDWLLPFDASYAHVGGSPAAKTQIKAHGVKDLDQFANAGGYWRVSNRFAPHNVYTSFAKLDEMNQSKGYTRSNFNGFERKKETAAKPPTATSIDINISSLNYNPHYDYDATTNSYRRSLAGKPHTDERSSAQIVVKVVVALVMTKGIDPDGQHTAYGTVGSGTVFVFQDGIVTQGTWNKTDRKSQFAFQDSTGTPLKFNPGNTWLSIVDAAGKVTYK